MNVIIVLQMYTLYIIRHLKKQEKMKYSKNISELLAFCQVN